MLISGPAYIDARAAAPQQHSHHPPTFQLGVAGYYNSGVSREAASRQLEISASTRRVCDSAQKLAYAACYIPDRRLGSAEKM